MALQTFYAIDSEALTVSFSTTQAVGDSIINNSDSPDGTQYVFGGYTGSYITVDDTGGAVATLEDDQHTNHIIVDGGGIVTDGNGIEAESIILLQELDSFGNPVGPVITLTVFSQNGNASDVWGFSADRTLRIGTEYEKVGGSDTGAGDYFDFQIIGDGLIDGTVGDDVMGAGFQDAQTDAVDGVDGDDDLIYGYAGSDSISAGAGHDVVYGDDDQAEGNTPPSGGGTFNDTIDGGAGDDFLDGGYEDDSILGGLGADTIIGGQGLDTIDGGDEADLIYGDFSADLTSFDRSKINGGVNFKLRENLQDSNNIIDLDYNQFTGGDKNLPGIVNFRDDTKPTAANLAELHIAKIGNQGGTDVDVMYFNMALFDDDFIIRLKSEGAEDIIQFDNVVGSTVSGDNTIIEYIGRDDLTHFVTVEKTPATIEIVTSANEADFIGDADVLTGGAGADTLDGGFGADIIDGGADNDTIHLSVESDTIDGGLGTDTYTAQNPTTNQNENIEVLVSNIGNGTVTKVFDGSVDQITSIETFVAEVGGADKFTMATSLQTIDISGLNNASIGVFTDAVGTDHPFGGAGEPTINDILSGTYDPGTGPLSPRGTYVINSGEEDGATLDGITFSEFEEINFSVVCFGRGTRIHTVRGEVAVEDLEPGDLVQTLDHGFQQVRWVHSTRVPAKGRLAPIRIAAGVLGNTRDLVVSPQHRMLLRGGDCEMLFGLTEVLVPAKSLINDRTIRRIEGGMVEYFHIMFDQHEIVFSEGCPSESFHPGDLSLGAMGDEVREELFELFPELRDCPAAYGPSARCSLRTWEGMLLTR